MSSRFMTPNAIGVIITRENDNGATEILLQKRKNNMWDLAVGGHVESGESLTDAVIREANEELGIEILKHDISFSTCSYTKFEERPYNFYYFKVDKFSKIPIIKEPEKCLDLRWFKLEALPESLIPDVKTIINNHINGIKFAELGWD